MADQTSPTSAVPSNARRWRRTWIPLGVIALYAVLLALLWLAPEDKLPRGNRNMMSFMGTVVATTLVCAWYVFLSGAAIKTRVAVFLGVLAVAVAARAAVRRVEWSGDMVPTLDFRWRQDRDDVLEAHRAARSGGAVEAASFFAPRPSDVLEYRGAKRDGIVAGPKLARDWSARPPKCLWRHPVGGGYSSFAVAGNGAITLEQRRDKEAIVCYDVETGDEVWTFDYPALFSESLGGDGPRATPTIHEGKVYSLGATGELVCLDLATGRQLWHENILSMHKVDNLDWGMSGSPLVVGDRLFVNPGMRGAKDQVQAAVLALRLDDGKLIWGSGSAQAGYSSPMLATLAGREQVLIFDGDGLAGFDPRSGEELWRHPWKSEFLINAAQPIVVDGDRVFVTSNAGCAFVRIVPRDDKLAVEELWRSRSLKAEYANPILVKDHVYGLDSGIMACVELETGKRAWKNGRYGHGQMLLGDGAFVVLSEKGELALVEPNPKEFRELARIQAIEGKTWNNPVLVDGRALVRNHLEMACYDLRTEE